ncbi:MAG TPA: TOBE-like domain-containing protein [Planctomycetota bacterium]|nr:TOBE-like domain-containing protein [Planctomycetota bacterium]
MTRIVLDKVSKAFRSNKILSELSLELESGHLVALLGPSGSGKTTLLRSIAGLEALDSGAIRFDQRDVTHTAANARGVGFVFQHYALFEHMSVHENIAFGLRCKPRSARPAAAEIDARVRELLELVQLPELGSRRPDQLSGGQKQRIALARALAIKPEVLLLDEPFGALDARVRRDLRSWLRGLHDRVSATSLFVTHDQVEALEIADSIVVLREGRIEQIGAPAELYRAPASFFVFQFLGECNTFVLDGNSEHPRIRSLSASEMGQQPAGAAWLGCARPHDMQISTEGVKETGLSGVVSRVHAAGPTVRLELNVGSAKALLVDLSHAEFSAKMPRPGETWFARPRAMQTYAVG